MANDGEEWRAAQRGGSAADDRPDPGEYVGMATERLGRPVFSRVDAVLEAMRWGPQDVLPW